MKELVLKSISAIGNDRYRVTFADGDGNETPIICEVEEGSGIRLWHAITKTDPDIFMIGYADMKATGAALYEFHDRRKGRLS